MDYQDIGQFQERHRISATDTLSNANNVISRVIDDGSFSAQQFLVIGLCLVFNMVDDFDITAMAIVVSSVSSDLDLASDKEGWIFSFALAGMMAGAMFLAPVSDVERLSSLASF